MAEIEPSRAALDADLRHAYGSPVGETRGRGWEPAQIDRAGFAQAFDRPRRGMAMVMGAAGLTALALVGGNQLGYISFGPRAAVADATVSTDQGTVNIDPNDARHSLTAFIPGSTEVPRTPDGFGIPIPDMKPGEIGCTLPWGVSMRDGEHKVNGDYPAIALADAGGTPTAVVFRNLNGDLEEYTSEGSPDGPATYGGEDKTKFYPIAVHVIPDADNPCATVNKG